MSKLTVEQSFFTRCLHCWKINEYTLRAKNVNTSITDDDIYRISSNNLGEIQAEWCELCDKKTAQMTVAYDLKTEKSKDQRQKND